MEELLCENDIIDRLRTRTVPFGHKIHPWKKGKCNRHFISSTVAYNPTHMVYLIIIGSTETKIDKVRSILAQMEYTFQINSWTVQGIPFDRYIYVPEVHPITGKEFHEHEDEGHVLKVNYAINLLYDLFYCRELVIVHDKVDQINCSLKDFMKLYMMNLQI